MTPAETLRYACSGSTGRGEGTNAGAPATPISPDPLFPQQLSRPVTPIAQTWSHFAETSAIDRTSGGGALSLELPSGGARSVRAPQPTAARDSQSQNCDRRGIEPLERYTCSFSRPIRIQSAARHGMPHATTAKLRHASLANLCCGGRANANLPSVGEGQRSLAPFTALPATSRNGSTRAMRSSRNCRRCPPISSRLRSGSSIARGS